MANSVNPDQTALSEAYHAYTLLAYTYQSEYCKFENFYENFIFANSIKRHICDVKNSQPGDYLPSSVNKRMISPFRESFIFKKSQK